ncbi:hypothetical protein F441_01581 [Phytophthora nicotianae CJ01A1]|uniref:PX domain-containing protein n=2 Tax=Phytophthora nicotianae TaxID=4792 RepID=W2XUE7_PHYNI|nr:hypothetical protein L915_01534 [Phytophthora nicotianae]ETP25559.1 hypothetical protein F441_01581 [Phytophthora nicotianae CJ01A1]
MLDGNHKPVADLSIQYPPVDTDSNSLTNITYREFTGLRNWEPRVLIDDVTLPENGIEIGSVAVIYAIKVRLHSGLEWVIKKRYSQIRGLHKNIGERVKHLHFPAKHYIHNYKPLVLQQRRRDLETYITELLEIRPFLLRELYNFLGVYVNIKSSERDNRKKSILSSSGHSQTVTSEDSCDDHDTNSITETETAPAPLGNLVELCFDMGDAVSMCEKVLERLFITRNRLVELFRQGATLPFDAKRTFAQLTARFDDFLTRNSNVSTGDTTSLVRRLHGFHCEIDVLQGHVGLSKCSWEVSWVHAVRLMDERLVAMGRAKCGCVCSKLPHEATCALVGESVDTDTKALSRSCPLLSRTMVSTPSRLEEATVSTSCTKNKGTFASVA